MTEQFCIVWNPAGHRPPSFRHPTPESAIAEAGRLAEANPGETFFVLSAVGFASADHPQAHFMSLIDEEEAPANFGLPTIAIPAQRCRAALDEFVAAHAAEFDETDFNDPPVQASEIDGYLPLQSKPAVFFDSAVNPPEELRKGNVRLTVETPAAQAIHLRDLKGDLNCAAEVAPQLAGVTTLIVPDDVRGPGIVRGHPSITALVDRIVTESGLVLKDRDGPRTLKNGEFLPGDRVRFTGRHSPAVAEVLGRVGRMLGMVEGLAIVVFDGEATRRVCSIGNLEHESLPQFEVGDRVRVKSAGLHNVKAAAGFETTIDAPAWGNLVRLRFSVDVENDEGLKSTLWWAEPSMIELVRPVQAGPSS